VEKTTSNAIMISHGPLPIRVLSHNIRYATEYPFKGEELWPVRCPHLVNELRFNTAHCLESFICLQEALHGQLKDLLYGLNRTENEWAYIGVGRDDGKEGGEYSPIFYRPAIWQLLRFKTLWLSETPEQPSRGWDAACTRILTVGIFRHRLSKKELCVMSTHLDHEGSRSRLEAAKIISNFVESVSKEPGMAGLPFALAGDFNSETHMEAYRYMARETKFADVHALVGKKDRYGHEHTFTGFGDAHLTRIDFIFINRYKDASQQKTDDTWMVKNHAVLENRFEDKVYNSDHRAVVVDLDLK
jgi:endonuclease/exonuclease/phosphatase family metal-dependent hydrolase